MMRHDNTCLLVGCWGWFLNKLSRGVRLENMPETESLKATSSRTVQSSLWPLYLAIVAVGGIVAASISWGFLGESLAALGIPDPGILTTAGLPFLKTVAWLLAAMSVGSFLFSAFFVSPLPTRQLNVDGMLAARTGALSAVGFGLISAVMIPMTLSDVSGQPLAAALAPANWAVALSRVAEAQAWLGCMVIALPVGCAALVLHRWSLQPVLLIGSIAMIAPLGLSGHSAAGGDHDYGTNSLLWHLLFMMLWVGGLIALIAYGYRLGPNMALAVSRFSTVALTAIVVLSVTGVINAAIRVRLEDLFSTGYGLVVVAKVVLTVMLGLVGWWHRKATMPKLQQGDRRAFITVAVVEVFLMAATVGVAVSLGRTPPPPPRVINLSPMALEMGYDLVKEPTLWSVWTVWRFDLMFSTLAIVLAGGYLYGLFRLRQRGIAWPWHRTFWWLAGSLSLGLCMSSGVGLYMPAMFSMHMVAHMVLSMVIPVFLVLGAPLQLVLTVSRPNPQQPGIHEWVQAFLDSRLLRLIMHPAVNTIQFVTIFYLLYITPWYDLMVSEHAGHLIMNWVFLFSGYLYYWDMIGSDPKPRRNSVVKRLAWLVFSMPFHLYFGVYLMQLSQILAEDFYQSLLLPWGVDLMHDQNVGGGIAWASGSFPLIVVFGTLFLQWLKEDRKEAKEYDQRAEETGDDDLEAYNAMLAAMHRRED